MALLTALTVQKSNFLKCKMADDRHFEKPLNRRKSTTVRRIVTKFGLMTHRDSLTPSDGQKFEFFKNSR